MKRLARALFVAGSAGALVAVAQDARAAKPAQAKGGLQLSILTPDPSSIGDQVTLDVVCKGAALETVELYVDNALVAKRQVNSSQARNILSFKLDTLLMSAGDHDVVVKAFSPDGRSSSSSTKLRIPTLDLNAPVRISYPQNGQFVSGVVPIRLTLDTDVARSKPYVTFFVDKEFKVLRNTPPYEYNWDTSRVSNGWHVLEAWSQHADAVTPTKARPINVNVNNGGGETKLSGEVKDLRNGSKPIEMRLPEKGTATPTLRNGDLGGPKGVAGSGAARTGSVSNPDENLRSSRPTEFNGGNTSLANANAGKPGTGSKVVLPRQAPTASGGAIQRPATQIARLTQGDAKLPAIENSGLAAPSLHQINGPGSGDTYAARPRMDRLSSKPTKLRAGSFAVAFDGTQIAFDVKPRIESGVKLAPFRQIFEHTGGKLYWFGGTAQTVRAVNSSREIELKIGEKAATVNNQAVEMEKKAYLDTGRTIVPLTFIRDALNVKINYDEKTGKLLIESKK